MKVSEIVQIILTTVTALIASGIGFYQTTLNAELEKVSQRLDKQRVELSQQAEDRTRLENERTFNLEIIRTVLTALEEQNEDLQRVLIAYFGSLEESPFKVNMLSLFRSGGASPQEQKAASEALGREADVPAQSAGTDAAIPVRPSGERTILSYQREYEREHVGDPSGWDFDVFVCETSLRNVEEAVVEKAREVYAMLEARAKVGRVRLRVLAERTTAAAPEQFPPGYYLVIDDNPAERAMAREIEKDLRTISPGLALDVRPNLTALSPWYISAYACPTP